MKEWARSFYKSSEWHKCRNAYIMKRVGIDGGMCEECRDGLGFIVHHKRHLTPENVNDPEISLNEANLEYVCKKCHDAFDGHGIKRGHALKVGVVFDPSGMPVSRVRARARESGGGDGGPP